jgi:hypothetical protein
VASTSRPWTGPPRPEAHLVLAGVVVAGAAAGIIPRWPGLVHLVALPPVDQAADLRVLLAHSTSIPWFVAGAVAVTAARVAVLAFALGGLDRAHLALAARWYLTVLPLTFAGAAVTFASSASLFYLLFWVGFAFTLVVVALTAAAPWAAAGRLRDGYRTSARHGFRLGTVGAHLGVLAALGALADVGGEWVAVALVPVSAALTVVTARILVADPGWAWARRTLAVLPLGGLAGLLAVVLTGPAGPEETDPPADPREQVLFLMSGVDSSSGSGAILEIDPALLGWECERTRYVSYAGAGDGQPQRKAVCPSTSGAPYEPEDTLRPTDELVAGLEAQITDADGPAVLAAHSQGVWISWLAAAEGRLADVEHLVLVGAFPQNPAPYQVAGTGPGRLGGPILDLVVRVGRPGGTSVFEPDSPLGLEWLAHPDAIEETLARPLPERVEALSITSVFDHPLMPRGWTIDGATDACPVPVVHPNLPYSPELQAAVTAFVDGADLPDCPLWRRTVGPVFRPFAVPPSG